MTVMIYKEFIARFNKQVFSIDYDKQLALAIDVCKKLYFDYVDFSEKYKWGDKDILLEAISLAEQSNSKNISQNIINNMLSQLDAVTPDMDELGSDELGSYALNACVAAYNLVQFIADKEPSHIYEIGICLTDTIDFRVQEQKTLTEQEIDNNPLMVEARKYLLEKSK